MSNEVATTQQNVPPFQRNQGLAGHANVGSIAIEQERATAEAQGQLVLAKKFPRDENQAFAEMMRACKSKAFADTAFYAIKNRGTGPTIRFAEEIARCYGNFQYGHRELSRSEGSSEIEVFAWDMERNNRNTRQVTVRHIRDAQGQSVPLRTQDDIDARISNVASKQVRSRILALVPKWLVAEAIEECKKTIAGNNDVPIEQRIIKMQKAFATVGVNVKLVEAYLGHALATTTPEEIADITGIYNAIKEGAPVSEFFTIEDEKVGAVAAVAESQKLATTAAKKEPEVEKPKAEKPAPKAKQEAAPQKPKPEYEADLEPNVGSSDEEDDLF